MILKPKNKTNVKFSDFIVLGVLSLMVIIGNTEQKVLSFGI